MTLVKTPDELRAEAQADAEQIIADARNKAAKILWQRELKDERVKKASYKMADDKYTELDIVRVKATEEALHHTPGALHDVHGLVAQKLIQKGEVSFVSITLKAAASGERKGLHARKSDVAVEDRIGYVAPKV